MALWNKTKSVSKVTKEAKTTLAELQLELQDMDLQLITYNHHRNAILEKIKYFEKKLSEELPQEPVSTPKQVEVKQVLDTSPKAA